MWGSGPLEGGVVKLGCFCLTSLAAPFRNLVPSLDAKDRYEH